MSNLRRVPYTKPVPANAQIITKKGERFARFKDRRGKTVEAPLTEDGSRIRLLSKKWYGEYLDADGRPQCVPLATDKTAAQQMLAELVRQAHDQRAFGPDPYAAHRQRPVAEHLADWASALRAEGATAKHVRQTVACAWLVLDGCGFVFMADLSASRVQEYVAALRERGRRPLAPLDPAKESYTKAELGALLGVKPSAVPSLVRRHRLEATGNGKARRFPRATAEALHTRRSRGRSIKTSNLYLDAVKGFAAWLVKDRRMAESPLEHLSGGNVKLDRRHDRRPLSPDDLLAVLSAARSSEHVFRGLTGADRFHLYLTACGTGFRAGELVSLTPESFDLDAATATVASAYTKNKRLAVQPLSAEIVEALSGYLNGKEAGKPVWPGGWPDDAAEMLRHDLDAAGVPYEVQGPDGPLFADFHALRHSYIALLDRTGATLKEAMQLARHSDPKLTMAVYGRAQLHDLAGVVGRLPALLSDRPAGQGATLAATGTDGGAAARIDQDGCDGESSPSSPPVRLREGI